MARRSVAGTAPRSVARFLRQRRQELGYSLRRVEQLVSERGTVLPFATLARIEQGKIDPGLSRLRTLLRVYNVSPDILGDLFELEDLADGRPATDDPDELYREGVRLWREGDTAGALSHLRALRELEPKTPQHRLARQKGLLGLSIAAGELGRYRTSHKIIEGLLCEPPHESLRVPVLVQAAICWSELGSLDMALAALDRAETYLEPTDRQQRGWIYHERASVYLRQGATTPARTEIEHAFEQHRAGGDADGECRAHCFLVDLALHSGQPREALVQAEAALRLAREHRLERSLAQAHLARGKALLELDDPQAALKALREALARAIAIDDGHARFHAHFYLTKVYQQLGNLELAQLEERSAQYYLRFVDGISREAAEMRGQDHVEEVPLAL